jgi:hypothetical protein
LTARDGESSDSLELSAFSIGSENAPNQGRSQFVHHFKSVDSRHLALALAVGLTFVIGSCRIRPDIGLERLLEVVAAVTARLLTR